MDTSKRGCVAAFAEHYTPDLRTLPSLFSSQGAARQTP